MNQKLMSLAVTLLAMTCMVGCATNIHRPAQAPQPAKVRFSQFSSIELAPVTIAPPYDASAANQRAKAKIDTETLAGLRSAFSNSKAAESGAAASGRPGVLRIEPEVKEIKFISGMARFWAGALAGSSAMLMQVNYRDLGSGEIVANPEFYEQANAWGGAWSFGTTDNLMLTRAANDIVNYTAANR